MITYIEGLSTRMKFAEALVKAIKEDNSLEEMKATEPRVEKPIAGAAVYLVTGAVPSLETISFTNVGDADDARRLLTAETKSQWGERGGIKDVGNDCYVISMIQNKTIEVAEGVVSVAGAEVSEPEGVTHPVYEVTSVTEEKDGKKLTTETITRRQFHRVHDQILYTGESERLFDLTLPSAAEIADCAVNSNDLGYCMFLDRVPDAERQVGWAMLSSALGTQMQQQDGETNITYNMRRASGDLALAILHAAIFDVDFSDASLQFANHDVPSILGNLRLRARHNSGLSGKLERAAGSSCFAAILNDNAAVTGHACVRLAEEASPLLTSAGDYLKEEFAAEFSNDPAMMSVANGLADTLNGIADHRNLELMFKVGWSEESDGVVYGGIQLDSSPQLLSIVQTFLNHFANDLAGVVSSIETIEDNDLQFIRVALDQTSVDVIAESFGAKVTHIYLSHQNSCLWYAAGGENAKEIIHLSLARCNESSSSRTPFVTAKIDMERWLGYPQDDPTGITRMPDWLDSNSWYFPPNPLIWMQGGNDERVPQPVMQRVFDLGGAQQFWLTLDADESGLILQLSLGEALANHMAARLIDLADDTQSTASGAAKNSGDE